MTLRSFLATALTLVVSACGLVLDEDTALEDLQRPDSGAIDGGADGGADGRADVSGDAAADAVPDGLGWDAGDGGLTGGIAEVATLGRNGHPVVIWTGTEFVVGLITDEGSDLGHVVLLRMPPGEVRDAPLERITSLAKPRKSVALAHGGGRTIAGWVDLDSTGDTAQIMDVATGVPCAYEGVATRWELSDLLLLFDGSEHRAVVRHEGSPEPDLAWIDLGFPSCGALVPTGTPMNGELKGAATSTGLLVTAGSDVWSHSGGSWSFDGALPWVIEEVDLTEVASDRVLAVFVDDSAGRSLFTATLEFVGTGYVPSTSVFDVAGWTGPDPAGAAVPGGAVVAFIQEDSDGTRSLALAAFDDGVVPTAGPCTIPNARPYGNDPEIACGAGYCAIAWQEGDSGSGPFVTRITQRYADAARLCP